MPSHSSMTLRELLEALASPNPVPGGGAAAALTGATGVSLLMMAAGIAGSRPEGSPARRALPEVTGRLSAIRDALVALIDSDGEAYASVMTALRSPRSTPAEATQRERMLETAMRRATDTQLDVIRMCCRALREALAVALDCSPAVRADVGMAIELLGAATRGAGANVETNVARIKDREYAESAVEDRRRMEAEASVDSVRVFTLLAGRRRQPGASPQ